jgi:hypothetical protein
MTLVRSTIDRQGFGDALLEVAKQHMRVEFSRDDSYIANATVRAADFFERTTGMLVIPSTWTWVPETILPFPGDLYGWPLPFQPQPSKLAVKDAQGTDVSTRYSIRGGPLSPDEYGQRYVLALDGAPATPITMTVTMGWSDPQDMPPGILNFILEAAAWFYENREAGPMPGADGVPYLNQLLTAYWVPRV